MMKPTKIALPPRQRARSRIPAPSLAPIDRQLSVSVEQQVYRSLREALMGGRVAAGEGVSIRSVADTLGVSAAPVREAFKRLEADGVLRARHKSAFYTREVSVSEFDQMLKVRASLEGLAAGEAAKYADEDDLRAIEQAAEQYKSAIAGAREDIIPANHAYHFAIYRASKNPVLVGLIENLWVRMGPVLARASAEYDHAQAVDHHSVALEAIRSQDSHTAEAAIRQDLREAASTIRAAICKFLAADGEA